MAMVGARAMSALLLVMALVQAAQAAEYEVGNQLGWTIPTAQNYFNRWTVGKTYYVGDKLSEFSNFINHLHCCFLCELLPAEPLKVCVRLYPEVYTFSGTWRSDVQG